MGSNSRMLEKWTPVVALVALALPAQATPPQPDFSGEWRLESSTPPGAEAPKAMKVMQTIATADVFGKPMTPFFKELLVTRKYDAGPRTQTYLIGRHGGRVEGGRPGGTPTPLANSSYSVTWHVRTLVIEDRRYTGADSRAGEWDQRREEWSFDSDGRLRVAIATQSSQTPTESTVTHLYRRR